MSPSGMTVTQPFFTVFKCRLQGWQLHSHFSLCSNANFRDDSYTAIFHCVQMPCSGMTVTQPFFTVFKCHLQGWQLHSHFSLCSNGSLRDGIAIIELFVNVFKHHLHNWFLLELDAAFTNLQNVFNCIQTPPSLTVPMWLISPLLLSFQKMRESLWSTTTGDPPMKDKEEKSALYFCLDAFGLLDLFFYKHFVVLMKKYFCWLIWLHIIFFAAFVFVNGSGSCIWLQYSFWTYVDGSWGEKDLHENVLFVCLFVLWSPWFYLVTFC